jgi:hypothetical protein
MESKMTIARCARLTFAALLAGLLATPAVQAGGAPGAFFWADGNVYVAPREGLVSDGPNCGVALAHPEWPSVWMAHFAGGALGPEYPGHPGMAWTDTYACFPTRAACKRWQREMRASFRDVEGWRTCLPIR